MLRLIVSRDARRDLRDIVRYISRDSPRAATKVANDFQSAFELLSEFPELGHVREDLTPGPSRFGWCTLTILPTTQEAPQIRILRLITGYRDVESLLP